MRVKTKSLMTVAVAMFWFSVIASMASGLVSIAASGTAEPIATAFMTCFSGLMLYFAESFLGLANRLKPFLNTHPYIDL